MVAAAGSGEDAASRQAWQCQYLQAWQWQYLRVSPLVLALESEKSGLLV